ncbi:creatininase family protein [Vulgatibacter sp.]|uniref:creatininase family protein n=1 Tax=Vulgatibacter sp. TaxID=1971226 RepID=UPI0035624BD5
MSRLFAAELTWEEARDAAAAGAVALVPVGSTEAHGPHLPLGTDVVIAAEVATRAADKLAAEGLPAVIFPPLAYGVTEFAAGFTGTVSVRAETLRALLVDMVRSIAGQGFGPVVLVNHHLEPDHFAALHAAAEEALPARVIVPDHRRKPWALQLGEEFCRGGSHAGCYETSLMLAADPARVRVARGALPRFEVDLGKAIRGGARTFREIGGDRAYFGDPAAATAAEGEALYAALADHVVALVRGDAPQG